MTPAERSRIAKLLGSEGGKKTASKYSKEQLSAWGSQGGRGNKKRKRKGSK